MTTPKNRARILILSHIAQFSLGREIDGHAYAGLRDMRFRDVREPSIGGLVALSACGPSKWYLSWVHEVIRHPYPDRPGQYEVEVLLESVEDGAIAKWSNVCIQEYDRSQVDQHPSWRWTDRQHQFNDRWLRACYKGRDAYIVLPVQAVFSDEWAVTLSTRTRFGLDAIRHERTFQDWRKVTRADMLAFYDESIARRDRERAVSANQPEKVDE